MTLGDTELKESDDDRGKTIRQRCQQCWSSQGKRKRDLLFEEQCFVSGIRLHVLLESLILHERVIRPEE